MPEATINGVKVEIDTPYVAGHTIDEHEARSLNQTRRENIRNNTAAKVKEMINGADVATLAQEARDAIQAFVSKYAGEYTFASSRGTGTPRVTDPFEAACKFFARGYLVSKLKAQAAAAGTKAVTLKEYASPTGQTADEKITELMAHPEIQKRAKAKVKADEAMRASVDSLGDL